jgi:DNA-binding NarL/FixJ family response regulator
VTVGKQLNVLIVDESEMVRTMLSDALSPGSLGWTVVGVAPDPFEARTLLLQTNPDVLTLDIEMPQIESLTFLSQLIRASTDACDHPELANATRRGGQRRGAEAGRRRRHRAA